MGTCANPYEGMVHVIASSRLLDVQNVTKRSLLPFLLQFKYCLNLNRFLRLVAKFWNVVCSIVCMNMLIS